MGALSKKLRNCGGNGYKGILHWCPGCKEPHAIWTEAPVGRPTWTWDGNVDAPTCAPSIRCFTRYDQGGEKLLPNNEERTLCHYFLQAGKINFCGDCVHELNGQQGVELPDFPHAGD